MVHVPVFCRFVSLTFVTLVLDITFCAVWSESVDMLPS